MGPNLPPGLLKHISPCPRSQIPTSQSMSERRIRSRANVSYLVAAVKATSRLMGVPRPCLILMKGNGVSPMALKRMVTFDPV